MKKKLMILAVLLAAAHNMHAADSWRAYLPSTESMQNFGMTCKQWISDNPGKAAAVGGALAGLGGLSYLGYRSLGKTQTPAAVTLDEEPYVAWDKRPGVAPLIEETEAAIKANNLDALRNTIAKVVALNLPYFDFDSFISRAQGITNSYRAEHGIDYYKAIDLFLGSTLEAAYNQDQQRQRELERKESFSYRWFGR